MKNKFFFYAKNVTKKYGVEHVFFEDFQSMWGSGLQEVTFITVPNQESAKYKITVEEI